VGPTWQLIFKLKPQARRQASRHRHDGLSPAAASTTLVDRPPCASSLLHPHRLRRGRAATTLGGGRLQVPVAGGGEPQRRMAVSPRHGRRQARWRATVSPGQGSTVPAVRGEAGGGARVHGGKGMGGDGEERPVNEE
jgi:hypothetical protein